MNINVDAEETAKRVIVTVRIEKTRRMRWRLAISEKLLQLVTKIAPMRIKVFVDGQASGVFDCPRCGQETISPYDIGGEFQLVSCQSCSSVFLIELGSGKLKIIEGNDD